MYTRNCTYQFVKHAQSQTTQTIGFTCMHLILLYIATCIHVWNEQAKKIKLVTNL
jgi:hypothetical protein